MPKPTLHCAYERIIASWITLWVQVKAQLRVAQTEAKQIGQGG